MKCFFQDKKGQSMVEFAIVFPVMMLLTMGIMQLALIYTAKQVVHYAAFSAARAQLVGGNAERAAEIVCTPITGRTLPGDFTVPDINIPGWDVFARSGVAKIKTSAEIKNGKNEVTVEVTHHFELIMPLINRVFVFPWEDFLGIGGEGTPAEYYLEELKANFESVMESGDFSIDWDRQVPNYILSSFYQQPHIIIKAKSTLPKPWEAVGE